jgi:hypothetical protein
MPNVSPYKVRFCLQILLILFIFTIFGCSPARHVPEGSYLLSKNKIETTQNKVSEDQLTGYIIQVPNKRILGIRFYLFLYNLSNIEKEKWPNGWLRKIGEEPVVYDPGLKETSTDQLRQFLENKGFYKAEVEDSVKFKGKNAKVSYDIRFNEPYRVRKISYFFEDTGLVSKVLPDTVNSLLKKGMRFDKDVLQQERTRIETMLKEQGYYSFSKEYIFYNATIDAENNNVNLSMHIKEYSEGKVNPYTKVRHHPKYKINHVTVYPDFSDITAANSLGISNDFDTVVFKNLFFLNNRKPHLKPSAVFPRIYIIPGEYYKLSNVNQTYLNLTALSIIRFTNITFHESDTIASFGTDKYLDARIEITQRKLQSLQAEIVGTNSAGDLGVRGNLMYSNFNIFKGAEVFNMKLTGAIESLENQISEQTSTTFRSMKEAGIESSISFPKFFSPFRLEGFVRKFAPKTTITASFNYQSRPDFTRSIANGSFSYRWNGTPYITHSVWPMELSYVRVYENLSSQDFLNKIRNTPLGYSFENHVINDARYSFELNNQSIGKSRDFFFARVNVESAGNLLHLAHTTFNPKDTAYTYRLFNVPYFQYLLGDIDLRYYNVIDKQNRLVYRLFIGVGYSFGNFTTLPYEKKYFSGGPNSIRAWNTRDLGPGSDTTRNMFSYFPNKSGDIKLEANIEYRFKLIWKVEAALFVDAGNVWNIRKDENKPGAEFDWNRFPKEIAIGTGFGARFDFSFFLLRVDVGIKLRDPALPESERWFNDFKGFTLKDDLHWKFGIGYPF